MSRIPKPEPAPITSSIRPEKALARLQRLLDQIPQLRAEGSDAPLFATWRQDVQIVLSQCYGRPSLQFEQFDGTLFGPIFYQPGMPHSIITDARLGGLAIAEGFLQSRVAELTEDLREAQAQPFFPKSNTPLSTRKVFVVHGHDHGSKEAAARYLEKLGLEPVILHEQPDRGPHHHRKVRAPRGRPLRRGHPQPR